MTEIIPSDVGADPTGSTDTSAYVQAAVDALPQEGGVLRLPGDQTYKCKNILVTKPIKILGDYGGSISRTMLAAPTGSDSIFDIRSSFVTVQGVTFSAPGLTPSGTAISFGNDTRQVSDASMAFGSNLFNSLTAGFSPTDIGASVNIGECGIFFATITSVNSPSQAVLSQGATVAGSAAVAQIGRFYQYCKVQDVYAINCGVGLRVGATQASVFNNVNTYGPIGCVHHNKLWGDSGDNCFSDCNFHSNNNTSGIAFQLISGGGGKFNNCKFLGGGNGFMIYWSAPSISLGPWMVNCSIEGGSANGLYIYCQSHDLDAINWIGGEIGVAGNPIIVAADAPHKPINLNISGVQLRLGSNTGTAISIGKADKFTLAPSQIDVGPGGTGIILGAGTSNGVVRLGCTTAATKIYNYGTDNLVEGFGYNKTALPSPAKYRGQTIFVENDVGGSVIAFSDGTVWRRCTDRAVIS